MLRLILPIAPAFYDFDPAQIANNNAYIRWMEQGRGAWLAATPWPLERCLAEGLVPVLRRTAIDYVRPLRLGEAIQLILTPTQVGASKWALAQRFVDPHHESRVYAVAEQVGGFIELSTGRPIRMPRDLRAALIDSPST